ncbi:hypothetical protein FSP39_021511 [Pinctada imbricata]|uniref:Anaphase-promoting complex subunit 1 n=1 Tax=Pinctada imbricata TaxID=66713 RepID=A0AA88Y141_PINIB|nr:hypothetical protein FSP39_021511 [Pinctada imbricata]
MIAACDTQDFIPYGRDYIQRHPGKFQLQVQSNVQAEHGIPLIKSFRDISLQENPKKEIWVLRDMRSLQEAQAGSFDEELYVSGNTVVWSKGGRDQTRHVIKTFTMESPVLQALWCDFIIPSRDADPKDSFPGAEPIGEEQEGICIIEAGTVTCFTEKNGEYTAALPFQVANTWKIKNGVLFERTVSPTEITSAKRNSPNQTTVFSMLHPLDEVAPVITKTNFGGCPKTSYLTDSTQHIVYTNIDPSLVLTYDSMVGVHSAWHIRKARSEESNAVCGFLDASIYNPIAGTPLLNQSSSNSHFISNLSSQSPSVSPLRTYSGRISSPAGYGPQTTAHSPSVSNMATISRSLSPAVGQGPSSLHRHTPVIGRSPGNYFRTPPVASHNVSLINESWSEWVEPLKPEICFEHLWTEPAPAIRDGSLGKASKAFLTRDVCGQQYLCYLITYRQQLRCVKFEESNDLSQLIFGAVSVIPAKDALPIESHDLMVLVDPSGGLWVYTGITKINRLHVPTLPLGSGSISMLKPATPLSSPTRGGIFTSSRPPSAMEARFDEEITHISPVQTELEDSSHFDEYAHSSFIQGVRDNVGQRFTIEMLQNRFCRTNMPSVTSSPGIELCLKALKHMLPKDLAILVYGKWYTARNTPGGLGNQSEWVLFTRSLLSLMGYDITRLALTSQKDLDLSMSPVTSVKKPRQSDQGSEEDWEYMVNSDHHRYYMDGYDAVLGLKPCPVIPDATSYSRPCAINQTAALFAHIPSVFVALHLIFEEMKLNTLLADELQYLVKILFQIASDLRCSTYMDYYCRNYPSLFHVVDDVSQVTEENLHKMQYPGVYTQFVMSVDQWVASSLSGDTCGAFPYIPGVCNNIKNIVSLYALLLKKEMNTDNAIDRCLRRIAPAGHRAPTCDLSLSRSFSVTVPSASVTERIVLLMTELELTMKNLEYLPVGLTLPIREAIFHCRCNPPSDWPEPAYVLIGRQDLSQLKSIDKTELSAAPGVYTKKPLPDSVGEDEEDGMEHMELLRLRFSEDLRVQEARRLLQSSRPARIALVQRPEVSDHDFIEEQERHLYNICIRTMALPVGRGIFTLSTFHLLPTETLPIPKLCLQGKAPPRNATVDLTHIDTPPNMSAWPQFHNGVAAGLRIANSSHVDSTWIVYNKSKTNELTNEYAGFLMALGLNGHLVKLNTLNIHDYLSKGHEFTTIGLLIGMAAAK